MRPVPQSTYPARRPRRQSRRPRPSLAPRCRQTFQWLAPRFPHYHSFRRGWQRWPVRTCWGPLKFSVSVRPVPAPRHRQKANRGSDRCTQRARRRARRRLPPPFAHGARRAPPALARAIPPTQRALTVLPFSLMLPLPMAPRPVRTRGAGARLLRRPPPLSMPAQACASVAHFEGLRAAVSIPDQSKGRYHARFRACPSDLGSCWIPSVMLTLNV